MSDVILTAQQSAGVDRVAEWYRSPYRKPLFVVHGPAGTGKTEMVRHAVEATGARRVEHVTYTGKAALVLRRRGVPCNTIHSRIYRWVEDAESEDGTKVQPQFVLDKESALRDADLLVIDECSMIDGETARDLLSFEVPTVVLGDPEQLPPINGEGTFSALTPDVVLTEIHRQALESPILRLATSVRTGDLSLPPCDVDGLEVTSRPVLARELQGFDQVICGLHATRRRANNAIRAVMGFEAPTPNPEDKVVCLRNSRLDGLVNGGFLTLEDAILDGDMIVAVVRTEEGARVGERNVWAGPFLDHVHHVPLRKQPRRGVVQADFGYALTCHKAQGSGFPRVAVIVDGWGRVPEDRKRWLYTAITRAERELLVVARA